MADVAAGDEDGADFLLKNSGPATSWDGGAWASNAAAPAIMGRVRRASFFAEIQCVDSLLAPDMF